MCKISKQRIHMYVNDESMIEFDVTAKFTKLFDVNGLPEGSEDKIVVRSVVDELGDNLKNVKLSSKIESAAGEALDVPVTIGAAIKTKEVLVTSSVSMHVNGNKKIFLIIVTYP